MNNPKDELDHAVKLAKPKVIFFVASAIKTVTKIIQKNSFISHGIVLENSSTPSNEFESVPQVLTYSEFYQNAKVTTSSPDDFTCDPQNIYENIALLLFSSGTTGLSKGVQFTQKNIFFLNIRSYVYNN